MNNFYTYLYTDPSRNEPIYVGKGKDNRAYVHLKRKDSCHFINRLQKMKREGIEPVITFLCKDVDEELAFLCEVMAIEKYGRKDLGKGPLLNLTDGDDGTSGYKHTDEDKQRIRDKHIGMKHTEKTKKLISELQIGKTHTPESVAKRAASNTGKTRTDETRKKMSEWQIGRKMSDEARTRMSASASKPRSEAWMKARSKRCTVDGITIFNSRNELKKVLGQGKLGIYHPNFHYVEDEQ